jgi:hypothetical protein
VEISPAKPPIFLIYVKEHLTN